MLYFKGKYVHIHVFYMYIQYAFVNLYFFMKLRFLFCIVIFIKKPPFHKVLEMLKFLHGHNNLEVDTHCLP